MSVARDVCVGVVALIWLGCAETGDDLFRKVPDAMPGDPVLTPDAGVDAALTDAPLPEADATVDAESVDADLTDGML